MDHLVRNEEGGLVNLALTSQEDEGKGKLKVKKGSSFTAENKSFALLPKKVKAFTPIETDLWNS